MGSLLALIVMVAWTFGSAGAWEERVLPGWQSPVGIELSGDHLVITEEINLPRTGIAQYFSEPPVYNIHLISLPAGERKVLMDQEYTREPDIDGDRVVWEKDTSLYIYRISSGSTSRFSTADEHALHPRISQDCIAWEVMGNYTEQIPDGSNIPYIIYQDPPALEVRCIGRAAGVQIPLVSHTDSRSIAIDGSRLVWDDPVEGTSQIFLHDLRTGTTIQITDGKGSKVRPDISGDWVVWEDGKNKGDIALYDIPTGTTSYLAEGPGEEVRPRIADGRVIWVEESRTGDTLWLADAETGTRQQVLQAIGNFSGFGIPVAAISPDHVAAMAYNQSSALRDLHLITLPSITTPTVPAVGTTPTIPVTGEATPAPSPKTPGFSFAAALAGVGAVLLMGRLTGRKK